MKNILFPLLLSSSLCLGQINEQIEGDQHYQLINQGDIPLINITSMPDAKIKGSYHLNEKFSVGTILFTKTKQKIKQMLRYNAFTREIEAQQENKIVALKPIMGIEIYLSNKTFVPIKDPSNNKDVFAENLVQGKNNLYNLYHIKVSKAISDASLLNIESADEIKIVDNFYYNEEGSALKKLPKRKKELKKTFSSETRFIVSEKLNLNKQSDLIRLFEHKNKSSSTRN